ncbi:Hypothetical predicted protein [Lecanosticta acicola]|uniref:DNA replication regulator Sld3 C-terminal domain-containing protein n=1 Tax=Lecanosticta acicola TaxID=111012 RepID=A0AAI9EAF3_9PEZI|nr:Hypothetical predicted protein [Lecanosticta acicola]
MSITSTTLLERDPTEENIPASRTLENPRKRKRDEEIICSIDKRPLILRPDSSDPFAKPRTLTPLCLLSRSQLPLSYLDPGQDGSRLLSSHVQILEACDEYQSDANVLIVKDVKEQRLYAIERVQRLQYALCRLDTWVKTEEVLLRSELSLQADSAPSKRQAVQSDQEGKPWWAKAAVDPEYGFPPSLKPSSLRLSMRPCTVTTATQAKRQLPTQIEDSGPPVDETTVDERVTLKPTPDTLEDLAKQYLDALYLSRTSVAYFVKGPLARVRAAFAAQPAELVAFLRGAVLSATTTDKKYRASIADLVNDLPVLDTPETKPKKQKKRKWKPARDKSGFFVSEKDYVEQWWRKGDDTQTISHLSETMDAVVRRRSQRLRSRETFLQVILILEVLALEASGSPTPVPQATESQAPEDPGVTAEKKPRKKKEVDMTAVLETLLDRLCIWYSIDGGSPAKTGSDRNENGEDGASDDLKSFASEVVIPFWASRIPEVANSTSKKLGGPSAPAPKRRSMATSRKPGEPAVRQAPEKKPRRPLERVSTDTLNYTGKRPPLLSRSATDTDALAPLIKREASETPSIDSIPVAASRAAQRRTQQVDPARPRPRGSLLHQISFGRREVDLSAMSQASEAKLRKKAEVEQKVRDAITTLRKPNRDRAVEDIAKNADESFAKAISKSRANSGQTKKPMEKSNIAINTTPKAIKATPVPRRRTQQESGHSRDSADTSVVPASSVKLFAQPGDLPSSSFAIPQTGHRPRHTHGIEETPSRGFAKFMPSALARPPGTLGTLLESPTATRTTAANGDVPAKLPKMPSLTGTPAEKSKSKGRTWSSVRKMPTIQASPERPTNTTHDDSGIVLDDDQPDEQSIYDALGWNDDCYEQLA